jgi:hypothetical protein
MTQITQAEKKRRNTLKRGGKNGKNTVGFAEVKKLEAAEAIRVHRAPVPKKKVAIRDPAVNAERNRIQAILSGRPGKPQAAYLAFETNLSVEMCLGVLNRGR